MQNNYLSHKRNTSQSLKPPPKPPTSTQKLKPKPSPSHKPTTTKPKQKPKQNNHTLSLVQKSLRKLSVKNINVEALEQGRQGLYSPFFAFGHNGRGKGLRNWDGDVDRITEVQDSNSRREVGSCCSARGGNSYRVEKQNYNMSNIEEPLRKSTKSKTASKKHKSKQRQRQLSRQNLSHTHNKSHTRTNTHNKSHNNSQNEKTKSTISLSRVQGPQNLQTRTQKIQKSVKMLWECMGELWENSRVAQYKSEKYGESIGMLKNRLEENQRKVMEFGVEIGGLVRNKGK